jgi:replication factor C small subunit
MNPQQSFYSPPIFSYEKTEMPSTLPEVKTELTIKTEENKKPEVLNDFGTVLFEKYRPKDFNSILGQEEIIKSIQGHISNLPHMILEGPPGIGKTTLVYVLADKLQAEVLELNGSEERGIDIIRGKVLNFVRHASMHHKLKIVFFDEADSLTSESQLCLRPIIEKYSRTVRFIFACNYVNKIIDPLKSRCKEYNFKKIDASDIMLRLHFINEAEQLGINQEQLNKISIDCGGDMRKAINLLQGGC